MFKLRMFTEVGSPSYNEGIKTIIYYHGTKKLCIKIANESNLKCEVIRTKDNEIVYKKAVKI